MTCHRCGKETRAHTMSMFNIDLICLGCKAIEVKHPRYQEAVAADVAACERSDYNFPGIGLPIELVHLGAAKA